MLTHDPFEVRFGPSSLFLRPQLFVHQHLERKTGQPARVVVEKVDHYTLYPIPMSENVPIYRHDIYTLTHTY